MPLRRRVDVGAEIGIDADDRDEPVERHRDTGAQKGGLEEGADPPSGSQPPTTSERQRSGPRAPQPTRHPAAHRVADDISLLDANVIQHAENVFDARLQGVTLTKVRLVALAVPYRIDQDAQPPRSDQLLTIPRRTHSCPSLNRP